MSVAAVAPIASEQPALPLIWTARRTVPVPATSDETGPPAHLERWIGRLSAAVAEVAAGDRAAAQLFRAVEPAALERLRLRTSCRKSGNSPIRRVLSVRVVRVNPTTVEACAVVQGAVRCQAVAIRVRERGDLLQATAVDIR